MLCIIYNKLYKDIIISLFIKMRRYILKLLAV